MNALESLRADFRTMHYEDCSASKLLATNGHLLVRKSAVPPEKFQQLKSRVNEFRDPARHGVLMQVLRETDPGAHELHVEGLITRSEKKLGQTTDMVALLTDGQGFRCWVNARYLRWLTKWVDHEKLTCDGNFRAVCLMKGPKIQAFVMPLHPSAFEEGGKANERS